MGDRSQKYFPWENLKESEKKLTNVDIFFAVTKHITNATEITNSLDVKIKV